MKALMNTFFTLKMKMYVVLVLLLHLTSQTDASILNFKHNFTPQLGNDTAVNSIIRNVFASKVKTKVFHYPKSLERFYSQSEFQPVWITTEKDISKTWGALLILDCVLQFGLNHADYHPNELIYSTMHDILERPSKVDSSRKAWFDMLLSDALITFMNHLHFGKLNPVYTTAKVDQGDLMGFCAEDILIKAMKQSDFMTAVLNVQPKLKEYQLLQDYMKLIKGQYVEDCYETPEGIVRKLAINMERLRWANINEDTFIQINIPSFTLKLQAPDTAYLFKVIVGKPASPTPLLQSSINCFSTAPDWSVPGNILFKEILPRALKNPSYLKNNHYTIYNHNGNYVPAVKDSLMMVKKNPGMYFMRQSAGCDHALGSIVFRFQNAFNIYLHDTPEQQLFDAEMRALSHGCIRVQHAEKLATTLLTLDGQTQSKKVLHQAIVNYQPKKFNLSKAVPLKITYLTCGIGENGIVEYDDIYKLDKTLELAFYGTASSPM